jgi:hypothetical protein
MKILQNFESVKDLTMDCSNILITPATEDAMTQSAKSINPYLIPKYKSSLQSVLITH